MQSADPIEQRTERRTNVYVGRFAKAAAEEPGHSDDVSMLSMTVAIAALVVTVALILLLP